MSPSSAGSRPFSSCIRFSPPSLYFPFHPFSSFIYFVSSCLMIPSFSFTSFISPSTSYFLYFFLIIIAFCLFPLR